MLHEDPEVEAWLWDFTKRIDSARYWLDLIYRLYPVSPPPLAELEHNLGLAQRELAIASVDLSAASAAATRKGPVGPPTDSATTMPKADGVEGSTLPTSPESSSSKEW